jgi:large subunit ribosomal protein L17
MTKPTKGPRLGNSPAHQRLILANLATQLLQNDSIQTTHTRAKRVRPLVEKLITLAKEGSIHSRRQVAKIIRDKSVVHKLFTEIAETFRNTSGGYVRITKTGFRLGDNAELAQIELLQTPKASGGGECKRADRAEESVVAETEVTETEEQATDEQATKEQGTEEDVTEEPVTEDQTTEDTQESEESAQTSAEKESAETDETSENESDAESETDETELSDADNSDTESKTPARRTSDSKSSSKTSATKNSNPKPKKSPATDDKSDTPNSAEGEN